MNPCHRTSLPTGSTEISFSSIAGEKASEEGCRKIHASVFAFAWEFAQTMRRWRSPARLILVLICLSSLGFFSLYRPPANISSEVFVTFVVGNSSADLKIPNQLIGEEVEQTRLSSRDVYSINDTSVSSLADNRRGIESDAILWPGWEVLVIVSPEEKMNFPEANFSCRYPNGETLQARFTAVLQSSNRTAYICRLPEIYRNRHRIPRPILVSSPEHDHRPPGFPPQNLPLWNHLVFDAISTEEDVVVFAKGLNRGGLGSSKPPASLRCVFEDGSGNGAVKVTVTSSVQEVFRCPHPNLTASSKRPIRISLETTADDSEKTFLHPSAAYYKPRSTIARFERKSLICAGTMVYNVGKFLREWVIYHAKIGVERFFIYDNGSDDGLNGVVQGLKSEGYDVNTVVWIWPKTQEAGFSHAAVYAKDACTWMMYLDVDEFIFSPSWLNQSQPSGRVIRTLLPRNETVGQVSFKSYEYGPSNLTANPPGGVTQGYICRRRTEQRHKSILRLAAVDRSLYTAIHHFGVKDGYEWRVANVRSAVVNHYKYQAWVEFKAKFRRRVSAYVVDWDKDLNMNSRDRTPGLGYKPVEPKGWAQMFCDVKDERLKRLTQKWFRYNATGTDRYRMEWEK